ncbi:major capsid protein [Acinetobacter sp. c3-l95]|uniref:major capsid protein n=1 Tax=Acinetobacter sp. c3-l95 TaxID=3342804 RepID=UPI0035B8B189
MSNVVIDQVLTTVVQGYVLADAVGHHLFPTVPVSRSGGQVIEFTDRDFKLYQSQRARGANTKRVDVGYQGKPYALELHSLEGKVPREDLRDSEQTSPSIKLGVRATNKPMRAMGLGLEVQQAKIARDPNNYPDSNRLALSGSSKWTDETSSPLTDFETARGVIRQQCGTDPNVVVFSPKAFKAFKNHPKVMARLGSTAHGKAVTPEMVAELIEIDNVIIGKMVYFDETSNETADVWGNDVVLAYTPSDGDRSRETPAYGYTYSMEGHPYAEPSYYDNNAKTFFYPVTHERVPVIAGIFAGYLMSNVA